ncbi:MAG: hypothetical protein HYY18_10485 [Planctomycetes bacterium]|nr:hypothetical protein [Planctomycetota bacterium]
MYVKVAQELTVVDGVDAFTPALAMGDNNSTQLDVTVVVNSATSLGLVTQGSNDMQGWSDVTTNSGLVVGFAAPTKTTGIAFRYVRLKATVSGTGTVIFSAGVNTAKL